MERLQEAPGRGDSFAVMEDLIYQPAHHLRRLLLKKEISACDLLAAFTVQIEKTNPAINALVTLDFEGARNQAEAADRQLALKGEPLGLLHGLPLAVKDIFATAGLRTTCGSPYLADHLPMRDEILVERERAAGAVILGKSNTPDCASGGITRNEVFGLTRNPWNPEKTTSGSGGGGVAALAAGMVALADGSDIGGSVRSPAAWTNLVGFRPSSGRLPGRPNSMADGQTSTAGIFARCVTDAALFMSACEGYHPASASPPSAADPINWETLAEQPKNLRVAWSPSLGNCRPVPSVAENFDAHRQSFLDLGFEVLDATPTLGPNFKTFYSHYNAFRVVEGLPPAVMQAARDERPMKPSLAKAIKTVEDMTGEDVLALLKERNERVLRNQDFMREHDLVISPTHAGLAFDIDDEDAERNFGWEPLYHAPAMGLPSLVLPCGFTPDGMPAGLMITGKQGEDQLVLAAGHAFEAATSYGRRRPDLSWAISPERH